MRHFRILSIVALLFALLFSGSNLMAQVEDVKPEVDKRPVRNTFESIWLIENQTVMVPFKGTFEMDIQHRMGVMKEGFDDFFGLFAPTTIRLGFNYVPIEKLQIGFGLTNIDLNWDFHVKYALLRQTRSGNIPLSISYLGDMAIDTRDKENHLEFTDRLSYFHQLMIARKMTDALSLQVSGNLSHLNYPDRFFNEETGTDDIMKASHVSISFLGRFLITDGLGLIFNYDLPITNHDIESLEPEANLSFGVEMVTSSHAFQVFFGNYQSILPQLNNTANRNRIGEGEFAIGFNITRLWSF
jgi:hypothetical protein